MYPEKNPCISTNDARRRQGFIPNLAFRPSLSCLKKTAPFPFYPWTDCNLQSHPILTTFRWTGRLITPLHCHGRNDGMHCTNTGASVALSGTLSLAQNTTRFDQPGPSPNPKRRQANRRGDTRERMYLLPLRIVQRLAQKMGSRQLQRIVLGVI
jgi:hypothetical protein